jgi:hypothetical protein
MAHITTSVRPAHHGIIAARPATGQRIARALRPMVASNLPCHDGIYLGDTCLQYSDVHFSGQLVIEGIGNRKSRISTEGNEVVQHASRDSSLHFQAGSGYLDLTNIQSTVKVQALLLEWVRPSGASRMVVEKRNDFVSSLNVPGKVQQLYMTHCSAIF